MRAPCEVCLDHNCVRPQREYRVVKTEVGEIGMVVCGPHSSALTIYIEREKQAAKPLSKTALIMSDGTEPTVNEVH